MSIKEEVLKYLKENKEYFKNKYGIKEIYLFGSVARGEDNEKSDIDLLVEFDDNIPLTLKRYFGLSYEIEKKFHKKIDLVSKRALKAIVKPYIEKDMINVS